ncbi:lactonase family protein [Leucobacter luti]|uniref:6-phosphogluconolactonase (Cycloisomerase 2 family) n=1 Tax=Leucobacter luti TaxID=340320 RepID=A0A4Q7TPB0_9MICO|nr:beta-propeller fold lactonase family protein [Leucobacter luti]RZT62631.1 6-phosphogluconolactonase (cycloisomerase 2 family) [Leucobacter luti]
MRALIGSYSVPSPWAGAPGAHGDGIVGVDTGAGAASAESASLGPAPTPALDAAAAGGWRAAERNPSVLALAADGAVWAVTEPERGGEVLRYAAGHGGWPAQAPPARVATGSDAPCHLALAPGLALVSHYYGGAVAAIACDAAGVPVRLAATITLPERGAGWDRSRRRSRPHAVLVLPDGAHFLVADCGRDLLALFRWDRELAAAELRAALPLAPGTGPRHLARHPASGAVLVSNQGSGGVTVVEVSPGPGGAPAGLRVRQTVAGAGLGRERPVPSEIAVHPGGAAAVLANRSDNSLTVYAVSASGELTERATVDSRGENPRHFAFSPDGTALWVAHQDSDEVTAFGWVGGLPVDPIRIPVATPTAVLFVA